MEQKTLKSLKKGEYFLRKENSKSVYIRGEYCRSNKRYSCSPYDNVFGEVWIKGETIVFTDFEF